MPIADDVAARFPARLKELRTTAGLSQAALAERAGLPQPTISAYERGANAPPWAAVVSLADALGVTADAFRAAPGKLSGK